MDTPAPESDRKVVKPVVKKNAKVTRRPDLDTVFSINADGSHNVIHPADVRGRFQTIKHLLWIGLIVFYLSLPWLQVDGRPALLIDIEARHFYLFGQTFNAGDFWFAFFFVTGLGFALFVVAALLGRVWCGYACPQTVFLEGVFRRVERLIEGNAASRHRLDKAPMRQKIWRRGLKMVVFLLLSGAITHSFLGYFMPVSVLLEAVTSSPGKHPAAFGFIVFSTLALFVNFTWFREQLCIVICPYGRLQGALYDPDTVLVGYDEKRGEPRGPLAKGEAAAGPQGQEETSEGSPDSGDCIDCFRCVAVCPTGIDIRNGTQMECVGCANCIDACDEVMTKIGRPTGLVRYDSQRGLETGERRFFRGRVVLYVVLLAMGLGVFTLAVSRRRPFDALLYRGRGAPYAVEEGRVHNVFQLKIVNKRPGTRTFSVTVVEPSGGQTIVARKELTIESLQSQQAPVHVYYPATDFRAGLRAELRVVCEEEDGDLVRIASAPLLGPSAR
ncbi:MAG: cytochrome c oxidase accessory protein CcoG [Planctomycetota bacterium]